MAVRRILAIDGGGVRGLVAAVLLDALDQERRRLGADRPICDCFDLIAGTSTGAIIAAGLTAPNDAGTGPRAGAGDLRTLYRTRAREIFPRGLWRMIPVFGRLRQFFGPLYRPEPLMGVLRDTLGDLTFADLRGNLLISSYAIDPRAAAFYRGGPAYEAARADGRLGPDVTPPARGVRLVDAVTGSAAAPSYFPPHQIPDAVTGQSTTVIDGGVFLNDPALLAYADARMLYPDDDIRVLSIGSGRLVDPYPFDIARGWGFYEWLSPFGRYRTPLISAISDGQARAVNAQMKKLLGANYHRLDYDLASGYGSPHLDDASRRNLKRLEKGAEQMAEEMKSDLTAIAQEIG